ncbi:hypothetical protein KPH14_000927, partial [Odynerus spinipes]
MEVDRSDSRTGNISRNSSVSSLFEEPNGSRTIKRRKTVKAQDAESEMRTGSDAMMITNCEDIKKEREKLEEFLFNEVNKINKAALKFILAKWTVLETKLYETIIENEKLKIQMNSSKPEVPTFADVVSSRVSRPGTAALPEINKQPVKGKQYPEPNS